MTKYDKKYKVNELLKIYDEMESNKHDYKNWYDFTGMENFEKAYLDMERAQRYLKSASTMEAPTRFRPVNNIIAFVLGNLLGVLVSFYYLRGLMHYQIGHNKR